PDPAYTYASHVYPSNSDYRQAQSLRLSPGDEIAINFLLISAPVVSIRGRVTNGMTGGPPAGAQVSAFWTPYMGGDGIPAQVSKQNGAFEIRGLAPGTYTLRTSFTEDKLAFEGEQTVEVGNRGAENVQIAALPHFAAAADATIVVDLKNRIALGKLACPGERT